MFYHLFEYINEGYDLPGAGLFGFISFRAGLAIIISLLISMILGSRIIEYLKRLQIGETIRDLGLEGQDEKQDTPTMGGIIIILSIIVPCLLLADLTNIYIILLLGVTSWMAVIGLIDDYIKVFMKDKKGLKGKFKILGQIIVGILIACTMLWSEDVLIRMGYEEAVAGGYDIIRTFEVHSGGDWEQMAHVKATLTNIPFIKENNFDYNFLLWFLGDNADTFVWIVFIPVVIFLMAAVSNAANLTDGLDGLATGVSAIIGGILGIFAYVSGNVLFADYLDILYLPYSGEMVIYSACFIGACIGFLWYNAYPAKVFMGDTGSLTLGGVIACMAILLRKELMIPILCGIFLVENLSVVMQVAYFKYTKRKYGEGRRIFKMAPLHHHYQMTGMHESKIVTRFWIMGLLLAVLSVITLKIR